MKKSTRLLAMLLVFVMVVALMPTFAISALADTKVIDGETVHDSDTRDKTMLQFQKTRIGSGTGNGYSLTVINDRHIISASVDNKDWGYKDSTYWLIPKGHGVIDFTIERTQSPHSGTTDINRWWRWSSWVSDTEWKDDGLNGMYAHIDGTKDDDHLNIVKSTDTKNCIIDFNRGDYYTWTGGGVNRANFAVVKVDSSNLAVGTTGVLKSANGTKYLSEVAQSWVSNGWVRAGDQGTHTIVICEEKDVVYDLNGGYVGDKDTNDQRYVCWTTGNTSTSQLHDTVAEPTRDGYTFLGWKCVSNDGKSAVKVGTVYQAGHDNCCFAVLSNVKFEAVWAKDEFTIKHVQNNTVVGTENINMTEYGKYVAVASNQAKQYQPTTKLDITTKVSDGKLYGGTFTDEACTTPATAADLFNGGKAQSFDPKAGTTYYIWEVSEQHLVPKNISVWSKQDGITDVKAVYLLTAIDREKYSAAGFQVSAGAANQVSTEGKIAYEYINVWQNNKDYHYIDLYSSETDTAGSLIQCCALAGFKDQPITVVPYWVTLDGVKVFGTTQRTITYLGEGYNAVDVKDAPYNGTRIMVNAVNSPAPMMLMARYSMTNESNFVDVGNLPDAPEVPDEPEVPEIATVNVVDGKNAYEAEICNGAVKLTPAGVSGKLFAGWYTNAAFTVPADLAAVSDGDTVYAKYVSESYLQVKYGAVFTAFNKNVSFCAAVADKNLAETGFIIETKNGSETVVVSSYVQKFALQNAGLLFGVEKNAPLMTADFNLGSLSRGAAVTVIPYWVTADGTTVYGTARTLTYTGLTVKG